MYQKHYQHSNTSVESDIDDYDDDNKVVNSALDVSDTHLVVAPAQWSARYRHSRTASVAHAGPISTLPAELLIQILRLLHVPRDLFNCLLVSQEWCQCSVELLWHKPVFTKFETLTKMTRLLASPNQSFIYASFIRRLNFLSLGKNLKDDSFFTIAGCNRLERLTLINCDHLSAAALTSVLPSFPSLVAVDLSGVGHTTDAAIVGLAETARRLQGINLAGCKQVSDVGIGALAKTCHLLRRVKLSGLSLVTDDPISALAKSCPLLLEIDLNKCSLITDSSVRDMWMHSTHMREMRLSHCTELTDAAFPSAFIPDINGENPFGSGRPRVHDDQFPPLIIPRSFEHLRMLDLTACAFVTDDAVEGIISHAPKIRNLVLSKCSLLTDRSVENICRLGRHLHYLHLGHAARITDKSVRNLARTCTRLRYVDFANCTLLTDMSVFELSALTKLRRIGLVRVNRLTDEAIYALARRHITLERIHLSYCDQISVMAIHFLLQKLVKLTHLSLTGVPSFRQQELQRFCREPPKEFNEQQQMAFCVYSGKGVQELRCFLMELFDHITEINGVDDTEFEEDDTDPEPFQEDDSGDRDYLEDDADEVSHRIMRHLNFAQYHSYERSDPRHGYAVPSQDYRDESSVTAHHSSRGHGQASSSQAPVPGPSSRRVRGVPHGRTVADALPIIEPSNSPPISDVASIRSAGTNQSNGSGRGFFRTYPDAVASSSAQSNGARTPDLNFAEIGHGRGAHHGPSIPSTLQMRRDTPRRPQHRPLVHPEPSPPFNSTSRSHTPVGLSSDGQPSSSTSLASSSHQGSESSAVHSWPYEEPASPTVPSSADATSPESSQHKSSRRTIRSTITHAIFGHGHHDGNASSSTARH